METGRRKGLRIVRESPRPLAEEALKMAELVEAGMLTDARKHVPRLRELAERMLKEE